MGQGIVDEMQPEPIAGSGTLKTKAGDADILRQTPTFDDPLAGDRFSVPSLDMSVKGAGVQLGGSYTDRTEGAETSVFETYRDGSLIESRSWNASEPAGGPVSVDPGTGVEIRPVREPQIETTPLPLQSPVSGEIKADQGYLASMGAIGQSDLSVGDKLSMALGTTKFYFRNSEQAQGTAQMIGGATEVGGAVAIAPTGVGTPLAVVLAFHGGDNIGTGFSRIIGQGDGSTVTYQSVYALTDSRLAAEVVDQGIPFAGGVATFAAPITAAERQVFNNSVYRGLTPVDAAALEEGAGLTAKNPNGVWTAEDHVANFKLGTRGGALKNDPWIGTTRDYEVVIGPKGYDSGNGIVAINLDRVPNAQVEVWQSAPRSNIYDPFDPRSTMTYHRSMWAQEVSIYQSVPAQAIYTPFNPISQVSLFEPITYGLTVGGTSTLKQEGPR